MLSTNYTILLLAGSLFVTATTAQNILTVAGHGVGDGNLGTSACLNDPKGMAIDIQNNLYFADYNHHRIRKVSASTGIITTVAGNGDFTYSGDGGQATSTSIGYPTDVDVAANGDLFIASGYNRRVCKVSASTGIVTTVAGNGSNSTYSDGGLATSSSVTPDLICLDQNGNLYIHDDFYNKIRKVNLSSGIITTFAGNGNTSFSGDGGQAISASFNAADIETDYEGNVYISGNERIRKINVLTNIIATVAGNGANSFSGDGGTAAAAAMNPKRITFDVSGNYYITGDNRIRKVVASTGLIITVAGNGSSSFAGDGGLATAASFFSPDGVAIDSNGNLYVADIGSERVRKIFDSNGIINTIAGNGTNDYAGDGGPATAAAIGYNKSVAVDKWNNYYIVDSNNHRVRRVDSNTGIITTVAGIGVSGFSGDGGPATSAKLWRPNAVAVDTSGNLYISDRNNNRIRKVNISTGIITTVAGNGGFASAGDGGLATAAGLSPSDIVVDRRGNLYISDAYNTRVRKVSFDTGIIITIAGNGNHGSSGDGGPATEASFGYSLSNDLFGLAVGTNGDLFIADQVNNRIRKVNANTGTITTVAGNGNGLYSGDDGLATAAGLYAYDVVVDINGNLFIADAGNYRIRKVTASTGFITTVAGNGMYGYTGDGGAATVARLNTPYSVDVDYSGNIYIADISNNCIRKVMINCTEMYTLRNGNWNDPTLWSCGYIPTITTTLTVKHTVTVPNGYTSNAHRIKYDVGAKIIMGQSSHLQF